MNARGKSAVVFLCALLFLGFFQARWVFFEMNPFFWSVDDGCYLKTLFSFAGEALPRAGICETTENYFSIGTPLAWIPSALLGKLGHALAPSSSFAEWTIAWISLEAFAFWAVATTLLDRYLALAWPGLPPFRRALVAVSVGVASSAFFYATHRQVLAHPTEWLLAGALLLCLKERRPAAAIAAAAGLCLVRYNDLPALLMVAGAVLDARAEKTFAPAHRTAFATIAAAAFAFAGWLAFGHGYGGVLLPELFRGLAGHDIVAFLAGTDWGLLWTAPWFLAILVLGAVLFPRLSSTGRGAYAWIVIESIFCIAWRGNGSMFAYRYLTGAAAAALWVSTEAIAIRPRLARANEILLAYSALVTIVLGHFYQGMLSLGIGMQIVQTAAGTDRRIPVLPFFSTAMSQWGNLDLHRTSLDQTSPLVVWLKSLLDPDSLPASVLVEGPTLILLTLAVAGALVLASVIFARTSGRTRETPKNRE